MRRITIGLIDDHNIVRQGIRNLLQSVADFEVVGEAGDDMEAVEHILDRCPDVLVLDLMLQNLSGLELARRFSDDCPQTQIVILSMHANVAYVAEAFRQGASAYVLKDADAQELISAIRMVSRGRTFLSTPFSQEDVDDYLRRSQSVDDAYESLTRREREVLRWVARGASNQEIAQELVITRRTVENHRARMMQKMGFRNQADVARFAVRKGLL